MEPLKLRVLNKSGIPQALGQPDEIEVYFPYTSTDALVKRMSHGHVKVLNGNRGEIAVTLTQFELDGMPLGDNQNFTIKIFSGTTVKHGVFERALSVGEINVDGESRKVLVRR